MEEGTDPNQDPEAPAIEDLAPLFPAYEFQQFIAAGGMGAVYLARQISLDRPVAIKILARELGEDPEFRASFEAEAKAMARLNHPNLIGVYDFGEAGGMLFIIMEMVNGKSLHHSAYGRSIDPVQAGTLVGKISRGLEHAHSAGILHRDIKPGNILLDAEANPKIGDFGLATPMGQKTGEDEMIYGTPGYTAPEVYHRQGDHRADLFSVGILLHELLTGKLPDASGTPPSMLCGCSRAFDVIVARATNPNPAMRYGSAGELAGELEKAVLQSDAGNASTNRLVLPTKGAAAAAPRAVGSTSRVQAQIQAQVAQKKSPALAISIVCGVLVLILIAILAGGGGGDDDSTKQRTAKKKKTEQANQAKRDREKDRNMNRDRNGRDKPPRKDPKVAKNDKPDRGPKNDDAAAPKKPSPIASLATLKSKLVSGAREELPPGVEARNGSHFVLVDAPMGWAAAKDFAEAHGGHLAVLPALADRAWFREKFPSADRVWVGGGMSGRGWSWVDGSRWNTEGGAVVPAPDRWALSLDPEGLLQNGVADEKLHFAIQWRGDGTNPATSGAQLKRTAESIKSRELDLADFPVGTRYYAEAKSYFFIVPRTSSWDEARILASAAGGYLAVPSSIAESEWLRSNFAGAITPVWLGGFRLKTGEPWRWLSSEAWNNNDGWIGGSAPISSAPGRLLLRLDAGGGGWDTSDGSAGGAPGMLIEWSPPKQAATITSFDLESWLEKTDANFTKLIQADIDKYEKENGLLIARYVRSIKRLGRKFESALAGQDGKREDRIREAVEDAVREIEKNETILKEVPKSAPDDFHELQAETKEDEKKLIDEFRRALDRHFSTYVNGLTKQSVGLEKNGFDKAVAGLKTRLEGLGGDSAAFLALLKLEDPTPKPPVEVKKDDKEKKDDKDKKPEEGKAE